MTLALLITAVTGAWAQTETLLTTITATGTEQASYSTANVATVSFSNLPNNSSHYSDSWGWWGYGFTATVTAAEGYTITKCVFYDNDGASATDSTDPFIVETEEQNKKPKVNGAAFGAFTSAGIKMIEVYGYVTPTASTEPDVEVTTNAASEGATFTEASFEMPTSDVDVDYELVRDMGYKVAFSGVPTRARLAKDGNGKFHFADGLTFQLLDNIDANNPKDITSAEGITFMVGEVEAVVFEGSTFYQLNKETLVPLADFLADAHLGNYAICAVASTGEYDGSFSSGMITLFQGYEVTVPAGEYATYYRTDYNLKIDGENTGGKLYTITDVSGSTATATEITSANKKMPFLIYNGNTEAKTFLLIPTDTEITQTFYAGFVGTAEATTIAASSAEQNNYAFNGKQFVWVKDAIPVAANKCWLAIPTGVTSNAREINLVFGNTTGIESIDNPELTIDGWYDLNGRKLQGKPTKKGIYIHNGKNVVVK